MATAREWAVRDPEGQVITFGPDPDGHNARFVAERRPDHTLIYREVVRGEWKTAVDQP